MVWDNPKKQLDYKCPAFHCFERGVKGDLCSKHKVALVLTYGYDKKSKYWILKRKPLNRSLSKGLGLI